MRTARYNGSGQSKIVKFVALAFTFVLNAEATRPISPESVRPVGRVLRKDNCGPTGATGLPGFVGVLCLNT